jgi:hypothetical protein
MEDEKGRFEVMKGTTEGIREVIPILTGRFNLQRHRSKNKFKGAEKMEVRARKGYVFVNLGGVG